MEDSVMREVDCVEIESAFDRNIITYEFKVIEIKFKNKNKHLNKYLEYLEIIKPYLMGVINSNGRLNYQLKLNLDH